MYPIPRHLTRIFQVNVAETTEYGLKGTIRCDCGCRQFRIKTVSNIDQKGNLHLTENSLWKILLMRDLWKKTM